MAKKNLNRVALSSKSSGTPFNFTVTRTSLKDGKKTTKTGTLTSVTKDEFNSNGKMLREKSTPIKKKAGTGGNGAVKSNTRLSALKKKY